MLDKQDEIWKALSSKTRREILDELKSGAKTTSELVNKFTHLSRFGVMKHIEILRQSGLVSTKSKGRTRVNFINAIPLREIYSRWVSGFEDLWASQLVGLKEEVELHKIADIKTETKNKKRKELKMNTKNKIEPHQIVSGDEWLKARKEFLLKEKEFTRLRDELNQKRTELPWKRVDKEYSFNTSSGDKTLSQLFDDRTQLVVYHFMFDPSWDEGCKTCSLFADNFDKQIIHLNNRDVTMIAVSKAPLTKLDKFKKRMGWNFQWVSSHNTDFNRDFHVSFTPKEVEQGKTEYNYGMNKYPSTEAHGISVFYKDSNWNIFHTYSSYARGLDLQIGTYNFLDIVPKGRDESELSYTMEWIKHHDNY